jgi:sulfur carrier protein ThiS
MLQMIYLEEKKVSDSSSFTEMEKLQYQKIMFDKQIIDSPDRGNIYDFFFDPAKYNKNKYFNCLIEKRFDCHQLAIRERKESIFKELSQNKTQKLNCIKELLQILNITTSTAIVSFNQDFLLSKYEQLMSKRKDWFDIFALRDQKENNKGTKMRHITDIINPILAKWSGSVLMTDGRSQKRVNGKRVDVSTYKINPPLDLDIIGLFQ